MHACMSSFFPRFARLPPAHLFLYWTNLPVVLLRFLDSIRVKEITGFGALGDKWSGFLMLEDI